MYINRQTGRIYNGGSITMIENGNLFSGIPTSEQLETWGYEEYIPLVYEPTEEELNQVSDSEALQIITEGE